MLLAEQLVGEARARRQRAMEVRERLVGYGSAAAFLAAATAIALLVPSERSTDPALIVSLVAGYAAVSRVRFEFAEAYVSAEQLLYVPMLVLLPLPLVPLLATAGATLSVLPEMVSGTWHRERWIHVISESWPFLGPVLVLAALAPGQPTVDQAGIYVLAFLAGVIFDLGVAVILESLRGRLEALELVTSSVGTIEVEAVLWPVAFVISLVALDQPLVLLSMGPLVWLLGVFSKDRRERYTATLELNRAYRGTVMLLADVVEFEDGYTADHSRSVVELVHSVTEQLGIDPNSRQEIEFAALLHDVGKISIPKEILHKPAKLTDEEFELMKTHTIEGQFMLDRVGGMLGRIGEVVRSCHERWDGAGYPDGLAGEQIPLAARIVFVCDAYNAMTTDRPYRRALSKGAALDELSTHSGTQFDPSIVMALIEVVEQGQPEGGAADDVRALLSGVQIPTKLPTAG